MNENNLTQVAQYSTFRPENRAKILQRLKQRIIEKKNGKISENENGFSQEMESGVLFRYIIPENKKYGPLQTNIDVLANTSVLPAQDFMTLVESAYGCLAEGDYDEATRIKTKILNDTTIDSQEQFKATVQIRSLPDKTTEIHSFCNACKGGFQKWTPSEIIEYFNSLELSCSDPQKAFQLSRQLEQDAKGKEI